MIQNYDPLARSKWADAVESIAPGLSDHVDEQHFLSEATWEDTLTRMLPSLGLSQDQLRGMMAIIDQARAGAQPMSAQSAQLAMQAPKPFDFGKVASIVTILSVIFRR